MVGVYLAIFVAFAITYQYCPHSHAAVRFWLPQTLGLMLLVVTTLYVAFTYQLVVETQRLRQRPSIFVQFSTNPDSRDDQMEQLQDSVQQLVSKWGMTIGTALSPSQFVELSITNIGGAVCATLTVRVSVTLSDGSAFSDIKVWDSGLAPNTPVVVTLLPAYAACRFVLLSVTYGDDVDTYQDFTGNHWFETPAFEQPAEPAMSATLEQGGGVLNG
jgi:hypothetical protein